MVYVFYFVRLACSPQGQEQCYLSEVLRLNLPSNAYANSFGKKLGETTSSGDLSDLSPGAWHKLAESVKASEIDMQQSGMDSESHLPELLC